MKNFAATCVFIGVCVAIAIAGPTNAAVAHQEVESEGVVAPQHISSSAVGAAADLTRLRKSAGGYSGSASIPAPPCPRNYLFSCQPNLAPVPCAAPASYGSSGAYSAPIPTYLAANPLRTGYGVPQQGFGYGNQYYI